MIRYVTAGESHGPMLVGILEGLPAGLPVDLERVNADLARRQSGHGRGARQKIERDTVRVVAGLRGGVTLGSPVALLIENRDWKNWQGMMDPVAPVKPGREVRRPRPGHVDLAARLKYGFDDLRNALERASARETAMRVALGGVARQYLATFGADILSHVTMLGGIEARGERPTIARLRPLVEASAVRCADAPATERMISRIEAARAAGDTLGGVFEVVAEGLTPGVGAATQWDSRLDARLTRALVSIPAVKAVEIGLGFAQAARAGTEVHDPILPGRGPGGARYRRPTNNAGGLEGGITNGQPLVLRAAMKPISTTMKGLPSVDLVTRKPEKSTVERSDVCALPAAGVVGEAVVALTLAEAYAEKFGGDTLEETLANHRNYLRQVARR